MSQLTVPAPSELMPDVSLLAADGRASTLVSEVAGAPALVFFMRASTCAICLGHTRTIVSMSEAGEMPEHRLLLITPGGAEEAARVQKVVGSPLATVRASGEGHREVGLGRFLMLQHSGTFLLDAEGRVRHARTSAIPTQSFSAAEIRSVLSAAQ